MPKEIDRDKHSLLRSDWREYLKMGLGESEEARKTRERIRDRIRTGLYDVSIINQHARSDDIKQIFQRVNNANSAQGNQEVDGRDSKVKTHWVAARALVTLAWRGLRENEIDKDEIFENVIIRGIEDGEADYKGVPHGHVESDIAFNKLQAVETNGLLPVEKIERGLPLTGDEWKEVMELLNEELDRDFRGENIVDLAKEHLTENDE